MKERELISANLKVMGFCILLVGIALCVRGVVDSCSTLYVLKNPPEMWIEHDVPETMQAASRAKHEQEVMIHGLLYQGKMINTIEEVIGGLVVVCAGLYLCRKGQPIVRFLAGSSVGEPNN